MGFPWLPAERQFPTVVVRPDNAQSYNGMTWPSTCFDEEEVGFIDCCMRLGCRENLVFGHEVVYTMENERLEPKKQPKMKEENHLPNLHFWVSCEFSRV